MLTSESDRKNRTDQHEIEDEKEKQDSHSNKVVDMVPAPELQTTVKTDVNMFNLTCDVQAGAEKNLFLSELSSIQQVQILPPQIEQLSDGLSGELDESEPYTPTRAPNRDHRGDDLAAFIQSLAANQEAVDSSESSSESVQLGKRAKRVQDPLVTSTLEDLAPYLSQMSKRVYKGIQAKFPCLKKLKWKNFRKRCSKLNNKAYQTAVEHTKVQKPPKWLLPAAKCPPVPTILPPDEQQEMTVQNLSNFACERILAYKNVMQSIDYTLFSLILTAGKSMTAYQLEVEQTDRVREYRNLLSGLYHNLFFTDHSKTQLRLLKPDHRLFLSLMPEFTQSLVNEQLGPYLANLESQLSRFGSYNVSQMAVVENVSIFKRLLDNEMFGWPPQLSFNMLFLIHCQKKLRDTFLEGLVKFKGFKAEGKDQDVFQDLIAQMVYLFVNWCGINKEAAALIMEDPQGLLYDRFIRSLMVAKLYGHDFAKMVQNCHDGMTDPTDEVEQIIQLTMKWQWIAKTLSQKEQTEGMSLSNVVSTLNFCQSWSGLELKLMLASEKFCNLIDRRTHVAQSRTVLVDEQLDQLNAAADAGASKDGGVVKSIYDKVVAISERWATQSNLLYTNRKMGCLIAARALASEKKAVYWQLDTGNGKTYIQLLICTYLLEELKVTPVLCTLNSILMRQIANRARQLNLGQFKVIAYADLANYLDKSFVYVCDEHFAQFCLQQVLYHEETVLQPFHMLGQTYKAIMSSGHKSDGFTNFLLSYFGPKNVDIRINGSIVGMISEEQQYLPTVKCYQEEELEQECLKFLKEAAKERPVIVFGLELPIDFGLGLGPDAVVKQIRTEGDVVEMQEKAAEYSRGVIAVPLEFGIGTDIRFKEDAHVVVFCWDLFDSEMMRQLIARGVRSLGPQLGTVFTLGQKGDERVKELRLKEPSMFKPFDAAKILKGMYSLFQAKRNAKTIISQLNQASKGDVFVDLDTWLEKFEDKKRKEIEQHVQVPRVMGK